MSEEKDPKSYAVIGAAMEVHRELGPRFLEAVYQEAMEMEIMSRQIAFVSQPEVRLTYKSVPMEKFYRPDLICFENLVVELKAQKQLTEIDEAQILNVLKATNAPVGLLINFGEPSLVFRRYLNAHYKTRQEVISPKSVKSAQSVV